MATMTRLRRAVGDLIRSPARVTAAVVLLVTMASGTPARALPPPDYQPVIDQVSATLNGYVADQKIAGAAIALVDGDRVVWQAGFGEADRATGRPVDADTLFHIASLSKTFTAALVMQLVEQGRVDLDAPFQRYVPELAMLPRCRDDVITVRSVLDHHSGIPGELTNGNDTTQPRPQFVGSLLDMLADTYPERPVDTMWAYSNSAYVLLQRLIEHVTGEPFHEYTQRVLFAPMGMTSSTYDDTAVPVERLTHDYEQVAGTGGGPGRLEERPREYINGATAGGIVTSAGDMARYLEMLLADGRGEVGRVLAPGTLAQMWTPQTDLPLDAPADFRMGLGWMSAPAAPDGVIVSHAGSAAWNFSSLRLRPEAGLGVFVVMNTKPSASAGVSTQAISLQTLNLAYTAKTGRAVPDPGPLPLGEPAPAEPATLAATAGRYAGSADISTVQAVGDDLRVGLSGTAPVAYRLRTTGWFVADDPSRPQLQARTIAGRRFLIQRKPSSTGPVESYVGELVPATPIPAAWRARIGTYRVTDADPANTPGTAVTGATLEDRDGLLVLVLRTTPASASEQVLEIADDARAFTFGAGATLARGKGMSVVAEDGAGPARFASFGLHFERDEGPPPAQPVQPVPATPAFTG